MESAGRQTPYDAKIRIQRRNSGLLLAAGALTPSVTTAAATGLGGFGLIEAEHFLVSLVNKPIGKPAVIFLTLAEPRTYKKITVLGTGVDVHITLITLIDPFETIRHLTANGA